MRNFLFTALLLGIMTMNSAVAQTTVIASGTAGAQGDNLTWVLTSDSVLTIGGSGAMQNFFPVGVVWKSYTNAIKSIVIENDVTSVGSEAFVRSANLTSVTIGNGVTSIGSNAFANCNNLISVRFGNNLATIGNAAFYDCIRLASITIPNSVTTIENNAFWGCSELASAIIGNSVENIGNEAFAWCEKLTSVTIGNSVASIGNRAFRNCRNLASITSYALTPPVLGSDVFQGVSTNSIPLYVPTEVVELYQQTSVWQGFQIAAMPIASGICGAQGDNLTWILTGDSVLTIRGSGDMMDFNMFAPWQSRAIKTIIIEDGATSIGNLAFSNSHNLVSVSIPNSVTRIGERAFEACVDLVLMNIPSSVTSIGNLAFADCRSLPSVIIPEGVTVIGEAVFMDCRSLTSVTIPSTVTSIGDWAFFDNRSLTSIICYALIPPTLGTMVFGEVNTSSCVLRVPAAAVEVYLQTSIWQDFLIEEIQTSVKEAQTTQIFIYPNPVLDSFQISGIEENTLVSITDLNGRIVLQQTVVPNEQISVGHLSAGVYFVNANGKTVKIIK